MGLIEYHSFHFSSTSTQSNMLAIEPYPYAFQHLVRQTTIHTTTVLLKRKREEPVPCQTQTQTALIASHFRPNQQYTTSLPPQVSNGRSIVQQPAIPKVSKNILMLELLSELLWAKIASPHTHKRPRVTDSIMEHSVTFTEQPVQVIKGNLLNPFPVLKVPYFSGIENIWSPTLELHACKFTTQWEPYERIHDAVKTSGHSRHIIDGEYYFVFDSVKFDFRSDRRPKFYMLKVSVPEFNYSVWSDPFAVMTRPYARPGNPLSPGDIMKKNIVIGNVNLVGSRDNKIIFHDKRELMIDGNFPSYPNYIVRIGNQEFTPKAKPTRNRLIVDICFDDSCKGHLLDITILVKHTTIEVTKANCITLGCGWNIKRLLWIAVLKNANNPFCPFSNVPKDMIKEIQKYL